MGTVDNSLEEIKTMKLYSHVDRVYNELRELGYSIDGPLKVEEVNKFDNYHYYGTATVQQAAERLGLTSSTRCIDVGSGLGGTARYLTSALKCHVTAVELQPDVHEVAQTLTTKCGLDKLVTHVCGNFLEMNLEPDSYDTLISILVFLHMEEKEDVFRRCATVLKNGGKMYIEDQYAKRSLTDTDKQLMKDDVYSVVNSKEDYIKILNKAGFEVEFVDVSDEWMDFAQKRRDAWIQNRERHVRVHGEDIYNEQLHFFTRMAKGYNGGNIGGCKIYATLKK